MYLRFIDVRVDVRVYWTNQDLIGGVFSLLGETYRDL